MTSSSAAGRPDRSGPWQWPVDPARYDTAPLLRAAEKDAFIELGIGNLRRPYLAAHAFLLGGFTAFCRLGSFSRLTLAWRVFGHDRVNGEIGRIRSVLAGWGYRRSER